MSTMQSNQDELLNEILDSVDQNKSHLEKTYINDEEASGILDEFKNSKFMQYLDKVKQRESEDPQENGAAKMLFVDDSLVFRRKMSHTLSEYYSIVADEASNTVQALALIESVKNYDIMTLDHRMPGKSGLDFLKELYEHPNRPKHIIFITTESEKETIKEALTAGADHYIMKPFEEEYFINLIGKLI